MNTTKSPPALVETLEQEGFLFYNPNERHPFSFRPTMGAMLRFKRETGREASDIDPASLSDLCTFLWCCVASASKHDGREFRLSLMDFADGLAPEELTAWANSATGNGQAGAAEGQAAEGAEDEKKHRNKRPAGLCAGMRGDVDG